MSDVAGTVVGTSIAEDGMLLTSDSSKGSLRVES